MVRVYDPCTMYDVIVTSHDQSMHLVVALTRPILHLGH